MTIKEFLGLTETDQILHTNIAGLFIDKIDWNTAKRLQGECIRDVFDSQLRLVCEAHYQNNKVTDGRLEYWARHLVTDAQWIAATMAAKNYFDKETDK